MSAMSKAKERLDALRKTTEQANDKTEELKAKLKAVEEEAYRKDYDITSLVYKNQILSGDAEKLEAALSEAKSNVESGAVRGSERDALKQKILIVEQEIDDKETKLREATTLLRETDIRSGHAQRRLQSVERERDEWERRHEEGFERLKLANDKLQEFHEALDAL